MKILAQSIVKTLLIAWLFAANVSAAATIRVMTFNVWGDGRSGKQPLSQTAAAIRAANPDIVGLQEANDCVPQLAKMLGWNYASTSQQTGRGTAVLSRFPLEHKPQDGWGVRVEASVGFVWIFNVHFAASPYQPYQLLKIPYGDGRFIATEKEAIAEAKAARGSEVDRLMSELERVATAKDIIFITGDFNEPSGLDWSEQAAKAGQHPLAVRFPTTARVTRAGFLDGYRAAHPDEIKRAGYTWTPITNPDDPKDHHDRIDFVFGRGPQLKVKSAQVVGEASPAADIVVNPWPSDHRAVVVEYATK